MNTAIYSDQTCQLDLTQQSNFQCPFKPKIPYTFQNTFVQDFGQASYLRWQPSDRLKNDKLQINNNDQQCCEKFEQISQYYESILQSQIVTMFQLNELIDKHSNLLKTYLEKQKIHIDQLQISIDYPEQQQSSTLLWKQKWEQENKLNQQRDYKINELKKKIEVIQETLVKTDSYTITLELESWKSKYQNLTKIHIQTEEKLNELKKELEQLNQNPTVDENIQSKKTTVISSRRRQTKQIENSTLIS
ncbi:unnamed protein product [Paramecium primaurelia]|uniref:Uncharacterized protein n=1 Tax=Paramecium primaurelia TaxID=5886 RepID=A0A8S1Q2K6_PARPR|nr:unnamed protein product [Paramecium primaurelia]